MPVDPSKLPEALAAIEKEYGDRAIHKGSENQRTLRIPTGSYELDVATGGGVPIGRASRFWGLFSSGKSLFSLKIAANAQRINEIGLAYQKYGNDDLRVLGETLESRFPNGMEVVYYNVEKAFDKEWAEHLGVDTDRIKVVDVGTIEAVGETMEALLPSVHVHIVDSASHAVPLDRLNSKIEDWDRGLAPRVWGKVLGHLENQFDQNDNVIILIDQARVNLMTGGLEPPGGKALQHFSSMTLQFKQGKKLYRKEGVLQERGNKNPETLSGDDDPEGHEIQIAVKKSRVGPAFKSARIHFDNKQKNTDDLFELTKCSVWFDIVKKNGSWYEYGEEKFQGQAALRDKIVEDKEFRQVIEEKVYTSIWNGKI